MNSSDIEVLCATIESYTDHEKVNLSSRVHVAFLLFRPLEPRKMLPSGLLFISALTVQLRTLTMKTSRDWIPSCRETALSLRIYTD